MSVEQIRLTLEKLIKLHKDLISSAARKTEIVKKGDTQALNQLLIDEQKYVKAIENTENEREKAVEAFLKSKGQPEAASSINRIIELSSPTDAEDLTKLKDELLNEALKLKELNYLNQQLIYQSLQFVNTTLDMLQPQNQQFNYNNPIKQNPQGSNSMFDSRA
ncbi:flagellar protein FlgN [Peribacillus saganii]|uniref:Flagellar protein FlgN n=1 Tax=Peribacillus saganii TaxID=2303992 RepID=A0A372LMQ7_9BACI|nr:flagellar protein FlgN [Peribacillus saganii]RFU68302.1 flagellar protein FlgN [Peribacillus saganii]